MYRQADESLDCDSDCVWRWTASPIGCRHKCGIIDINSTRWDVYVSEKQHIILKCHAAILNSQYLVTNPSCLSQYNASQIIITGLRRPEILGIVQSIEINESVAFIKIKHPLKFVTDVGNLFIPICIEPESEASSNRYNYRFLDVPFCYDMSPIQAYFGTGGCSATDPRCLYSVGAAYFHSGFEIAEGEIRAFMKGVGLPPIKLGEIENNFYKCNVYNYYPFFYNYFIDE